MEYFAFEEDFVEKNIRCIPMIVRFKMDAVGIKLRLADWSKFHRDERLALSTMSCGYREYLVGLIEKYTRSEVETLAIEGNPAWSIDAVVPDLLLEKALEFGWNVSVYQWRCLTELQRFALLKLCRPGHENKNFPRAMREFGLGVLG